MEAKNPKLSSERLNATSSRPAGFKVRTDLHAGDWQCRDCSGQISGDQMLNPRCDFCQGA